MNNPLLLRIKIFMRKSILLTSEEFGNELEETVIIPVGSFEQHGKHMCLGTDTIIANTIAKNVAKRRGCICLPPVIYGVSEIHKSFIGTIYIKPRHFYYYISDIIESLICDKVRNVLFVNGHGANWFAINKACKKYSHYFRHIEVVQWWELLGNTFFSEIECSHAGAQELSVLECISKKCVRTDKIENQMSNQNISIYECSDISDIAKNGVLGIATSHDEERGKQALLYVCNRINHIIKCWENNGNISS